MEAPNTQEWLDLFTLITEIAAEMADDPVKSYERMGISQAEIDRGEAPISAKRDPESHRQFKAAWKIVCQGLRLFGLENLDNACWEPGPEEIAKKAWSSKPWIKIYRSNLDMDSIRFDGYQALVAQSFFQFFAEQSQQIDPSAYVKDTLAKQGITKENFREHFKGTSIANPWEPRTVSAPTQQTKNIIQGNFSLKPPEETP